MVLHMARPAGHRLSPEALEDVLTLKGLTKTQASERSGLPRATIASLAGGHHKAAMPTIRALADGLGVSPVTLFPTLHPRYAYVEAGELAA